MKGVGNMATTTETFLKNVMEIVEAKPVYTSGGSSAKECDCIG